MTPREKAIDLVESYKWFACWGRFEDEYENKQNSKKCALIAVNEILKHEEYMILKFKYQCLINGVNIITFATYWESVKQEIEKL
jgi:hypothetical protein